MTSLPHKLSIEFIVDVTYNMLNPDTPIDRDEVIIRQGATGWLFDEPWSPGQRETVARAVDTAWGVRDIWVNSAWFVVPTAPKRKWWVELIILFGDDTSGDYQHVCQTVETPFRHEAISGVVTEYERERLAYVRSSGEDPPFVPHWVEIDVHEER